MTNNKDDYIEIVLLKSLKLIITGHYTGKTYTFDGAGFTQYVHKKDAEKFLEKVGGGPCCSGTKPTPYFSIKE